jgi:pilus assembly protein CpaF
MSNLNIPTFAVRRQIASAISLVIQIARLSDGSRKVTSITEITGMEGDVITMQEIFAFKKHATLETGEVVGEFGPTGVRPKFAEQLAIAGIPLPPTMFLGVRDR